MAYRYIGNKTSSTGKLLQAIRTIVRPGATVADLMCGTASVSEALRYAGYRVIANDIMTFAYCHAYVRLLLNSPPSFASLGLSYPEVLFHLGNLSPVEGFLFREYSPAGQPFEGCPPRLYFTADNASKLDAIIAQVSQWRNASLINEDEYALLRHDLVLATNDIANIAGTYGHFRSTWSNGALESLALTPTRFTLLSSAYRTDHVVLQERAEDVAQTLSADLCYIDPPYMKRQYAANYHIIETVARGDEPKAIGVSGLRPWRDQYSDFCSKLRIRQAFSALIEGMDCPRFLISYSEDGLLTKQELTEFLSSFGGVEVHEFHRRRFRSNNSTLPKILAEYLFHLQKN